MPENKRRFMTGISLLLALLLLLTGCGSTVPLPSATPVPPVATVEPLPTPAAPEEPLPTPEPPALEASAAFGSMLYQRPDLASTLATLSNCLEAVEGCTAAQALDTAKAADACHDAFSTMQRLAMVHSSMDKSVAYWAEEEALLNSWEPQVEEAYEAVYRALQNGPHAKTLEESQGPAFFAKVSPVDAYTPATLPLFEEEYVLEDRYDQILYTAVITEQGKTYTMDDIFNVPDDDTYWALYEKWMTAHGRELEEIYVALVNIRNRIARELGFENYPDYLYAKEERPYTVEMTETLIAEIKADFAPVYSEFLEGEGWYEERVDLPLEEFLPALETVLKGMDEKLLKSYRVMNGQGLCDLAARPFKESGAYTTYLPGYDAPFVIAAYLNDGASMATVAHEFGHFHNFLWADGALYGSLDSVEVFSQALELMVATQYPSFLPEDVAAELLHNQLMDAFMTLVYQPYIAAVELRAYQLPEEELTVEAVEQIAAEEAIAFCFATPEEWDYYACSWVEIPHMFVDPLYTFAYATAMDVSLQLMEWYQQEPEAAVEAYHRLMTAHDQKAYFENLEAVGLVSPFAEGRMQQMAEILQNNLKQGE